MRQILLILLFFAFSTIINAQNSEFITEVAVTESSLSEKQKSMVGKIKNNNTFKKVQYVKMGDLSAIQKGGNFTFTIPGREGEIKATARYIKTNAKDDYEWYGTPEGGVGSVIVLCRKGKITASISLIDKEYEILSTEDDTHLLLSYDMEVADQPKECGTEKAKIKKEQTAEEGGITAQLVTRECPDYVRVLVLFTPRARNAVADINQTIDLCINQFHSTVYNSNMTSRTIIELAGRQELNFTEGSYIDQDVAILKTNANAQAARNNTNADIVVLLTDGNYGGYWGWAGTLEPDNNNSYAIVEADQATGEKKGFVHETGHLYGCRHDGDNTGQPYAHGYKFHPNIFTTCRTVMVGGPDPKLLNFSNPNVYISGKATGTVSGNNNARRVTETYTTIMGFRPPVFRPMSNIISGPEYSYAYQPYTWEAEVACGNPPYTFEWRTSYDGFNYGDVRSTSDVFTEYLTCPAGNYYYLRLDMMGSDGQTARAFLTVYIDKSTCESPYLIQKADVQGVDELPTATVQLKDPQPNPATGSTRIEFSLSEQKQVQLELIDALGQKIEIIVKGTMPAGVHTRWFYTNGLKKGIYYVRLTSNGSQQTKALIVQ